VPPLRTAGAVALFADRTRAVLPGGFAITEDNRAAVTQLCQRLDGIPLAIELAAARLRTLSPDQLLARLDDRFRLLTGGYRTGLPRHRTLADTVDWSFGLCSPDEQRLWERVSVFAGSFGLDAAEGVCGENVLDPLDGLVDKSVLTAERQDGVVRYRLLETLRHYGRGRLRESGAETAMGRRHAAWYRGLVERGEAEWFGPDQLTWFSTMRAEHANLRGALEFCLTTPGEADTALSMAASLCFYWIACGFVREGRYWLDRTLELATEPGPARAKALWVNGWIAITQGELAEGECMLEESRCLSTRLGDETALAHARHKLGLARLFGGDLPAGVGLMAHALTRLRDLGELDSYVLMAQVQLAMTSSLRGEVDEAAELAHQAFAVCTTRGELWVRSGALYALARVEWRRGQLSRATGYGCESLRLKRTLNDLVGTVLVVEQLAWIAATDGQDERAGVLLGAARRLWPSVGQPLFGSKYHLAAHEECAERARKALGAQAFHDAVRHGAELTLQQAVSYALSVQGAAAVLRGEQDGDRGRREEDDGVGLEQPGLPLVGQPGLHEGRGAAEQRDPDRIGKPDARGPHVGGQQLGEQRGDDRADGRVQGQRG
jgi:hypothetical protein